MSKNGFTRPYFNELLERIREPRRFLQAITGPRQVGKTTLVQQVAQSCRLPFHFASADGATPWEKEWIEAQWETARSLDGEALLILDEVQKIPHWPEHVKALWDEDTRKHRPLKVILLGSAPLLFGRGLTESLAGRFESLPLPHWSFSEMREAFGFGLDEYLFYGAYPGAAALIGRPKRWAKYVLDSLIETTVSRDILLLSRIDKPALLRQLFHLGCHYSGQILSYTKMLGQLQGARHTSTLAHYLDLLAASGLLSGLQKYSKSALRKRSSSPKFQVLNTALMSATSGLTLNQAKKDGIFWGRLVESAVGTHLAAASFRGACRVFYWREGDHEVDFVVEAENQLLALEVKSARPSSKAYAGMATFAKRFSPSRSLLVGSGGIALETFLARPVEHYF